MTKADHIAETIEEASGVPIPPGARQSIVEALEGRLPYVMGLGSPAQQEVTELAVYVAQRCARAAGGEDVVAADEAGKLLARTAGWSTAGTLNRPSIKALAALIEQSRAEPDKIAKHEKVVRSALGEEAELTEAGRALARRTLGGTPVSPEELASVTDDDRRLVWYVGAVTQPIAGLAAEAQPRLAQLGGMLRNALGRDHILTPDDWELCRQVDGRLVAPPAPVKGRWADMNAARGRKPQLGAASARRNPAQGGPSVSGEPRASRDEP